MPLDLRGLVGGFKERALDIALGFGFGTAASRALEPEAVAIAQAAWRLDPSRAVDPGTAAEIVAEDVERRDWGAGEAAAHGIDGERFDAIVGEVLDAPGLGELLRLWRRGDITDAVFLHGLRKAKLEALWDVPLQALKVDRLDPAVVAVSAQRGTMRNEGLLPVGPPTAEGRVPPMPVSDLDPIAEAAAAGVDHERLAIMARNVGLPPAPGELLQLLNRDHIGEVDYYRGISEGNTRNEWAPFLLKLRRRLLTPHEYAELRVRGWVDDAAMYAGAALSGMEHDDTTLLFHLLGRPIPVRQVTTGLARGGRYDGPRGDIPEAYLRSLEQGNLRPEWYDLAYANRYTIPSYFVLRAIVQAGGLTEHETAELFRQLGWVPELADKAAAAFAKGSGASTRRLTASEYLAEYEGHLIDAGELTARLGKLGYSEAEAAEYAELGDARRVKAARTARIARIHNQYVGHRIDLAAAAQALAETGIPHDAQQLLLAEWEPERDVNVSRLTDAQVRKAFRSNLWTRDQALAELEHRGYTPADAATLLDE